MHQSSEAFREVILEANAMRRQSFWWGWGCGLVTGMAAFMIGLFIAAIY